MLYVVYAGLRAVEKISKITLSFKISFYTYLDSALSCWAVVPTAQSQLHKLGLLR